MTTTWEYKVVTLKHGGGLRLTQTPGDDETVAMLNREGMQGWELANAVCTHLAQPTTFYFKRTR